MGRTKGLYSTLFSSVGRNRKHAKHICCCCLALITCLCINRPQQADDSRRLEVIPRVSKDDVCSPFTDLKLNGLVMRWEGDWSHIWVSRNIVNPAPTKVANPPQPEISVRCAGLAKKFVLNNWTVRCFPLRFLLGLWKGPHSNLISARNQTFSDPGESEAAVEKQRWTNSEKDKQEARGVSFPQAEVVGVAVEVSIKCHCSVSRVQFKINSLCPEVLFLTTLYLSNNIFGLPRFQHFTLGWYLSGTPLLVVFMVNIQKLKTPLNK